MLFLAVVLAVLVVRMVLDDAALWPSLGMGIAAGAGATVATVAMDRLGL